jgi:hypothetical protein
MFSEFARLRGRHPYPGPLRNQLTMSRWCIVNGISYGHDNDILAPPVNEFMTDTHACPLIHMYLWQHGLEDGFLLYHVVPKPPSDFVV